MSNSNIDLLKSKEKTQNLEVLKHKRSNSGTLN